MNWPDANNFNKPFSGSVFGVRVLTTLAASFLEEFQVVPFVSTVGFSKSNTKHLASSATRHYVGKPIQSQGLSKGVAIRHRYAPAWRSHDRTLSGVSGHAVEAPQWETHDALCALPCFCISLAPHKPWQQTLPHSTSLPRAPPPSSSTPVYIISVPPPS
jgi:hypothetical protein